MLLDRLELDPQLVPNNKAFVVYCVLSELRVMAAMFYLNFSTSNNLFTCLLFAPSASQKYCELFA
jgi:hypothetical protein